MAGAEASRRLFVALMLGNELGEQLAGQVRRALGVPREGRPPPGLRLYGGPDLHLTLFFLGSVHEDRHGALERELGGAVHGLLAPALELTTAGAFPDARRPRVLWVGVQERRPSARLEAVADAVRRSCVALGFEADPRPFAAHVTVGRVRAERGRRGSRRPEVGGAPTESFFGLEVGLPWQPREVALVESRAGGEGDAYRVLSTWPLAPAAS